jgi:hypothetical protein
MKDIIRMNQLAGIITEGQAKKMLEVLNENESTKKRFIKEEYENVTLEDFIETYVGPDRNEFMTKTWFIEKGNILFTIPYPDRYGKEDPTKPSKDVAKLENLLQQNGVEIIDKYTDRDGGYKYTVITVRYDDLVNGLNA